MKSLLSMNLENTNSTLTLIANIGVLIGLFLLIIELNQNSTVAHIDSYQDLVAQVNYVQELQILDKEVADLVIRGNANEELTDVDLARYTAFWTLSMNSGRLAHKQFDNGLINIREMRGLLGPVINALTPEIGQRLWDDESENFSTSFRIYASNMMLEISPESEYWRASVRRLENR